MTRSQATTAIVGMFVGMIAAALLQSTAIGLTPALLVIGLAIALWILRVAGREDLAYALAGLLVGILLPLVVPSLSLAALPVEALLLALALPVYVLKA